MAALLRAYATPLLALAGLLVVTLITLKLFGGTIGHSADPAGGTDTGSGGGTTVLTPGKTPSPSAPPVVNKDISIDGQLVFVKAGNLWLQSGTNLTQLTTDGSDSQPAWSGDGSWIYFIQTRQARLKHPSPSNGVLVWYYDSYPVLMRMRPQAGAKPQGILSGLYSEGGSDLGWFYFIKTPAVSPNGKTIAVTSDGPDASQNDVVLQFISAASHKMTNAKLPESNGLGHQDPSWSPDGRYLLYVKNHIDGGPDVWRYDTTNGRTTALTNGGYTQPIYSPDGNYIAATKTNSIGTNVVILDARTGAELTRVTNDGRSWGPAWSPDGSQLAYLVLASSGLTTDIDLVKIVKTANGAPDTEGNPLALTNQSGLDGNSRPAWFGSPQSPSSTPSAAPSATPTAAPSDSPTPNPSASGPLD